ncbi:VanZ family protein [Lyngbya confervoides BDU141951]|uniref:VanZ family protein n=2 Tax=Lyngbya TaxID=28073 RepID=A0ABD4T9S8_9CYAN|nr:VanZ family protein [Lyngbya confervoides]MCM1985297.1 VanZ family protein [Lyngbya confervoides BDU141951]
MILIFSLSTPLGGWSHSQSLIETLLRAQFQFLSLDQLHHINLWVRKGAHFSEYAMLTGLGYWMGRVSFKLPWRRALIMALAGSILYAISDEFHQSFVPGRTAQGLDVLIDSFGASTVVLLLYTWARKPEGSSPDAASAS